MGKLYVPGAGGKEGGREATRGGVPVAKYCEKIIKIDSA